MGRDFFSQLPGRAANIGGLGLDVLALAEAAQSPQGFLQFLQQQALLQRDPTMQGAARQSPFQAGLLGFPVHSVPSLPTTAEQSQLTQLPVPARISAAGTMATDPQRTRTLGPLLPPARTGLESLPALQRAYPESRFSVPLPGIEGGRMSVGSPTRPLHQGSFPLTPAGLQDAQSYLEGLSRIGIQGDVIPQPSLGVYQVVHRTPPQSQQQADPALLRALGLIPPVTPQGQPATAPTTPQGQPEAPVAPSQRVLPDDMPVGQLAPQGQVGYPPPAFLPGGQTAPPTPSPTVSATTPATGARRALPALPPGTSVSGKIGGMTVRRQGPPAPGKALAAVQARQLAQLQSSAQAARAALVILQRGPQHPLEVGGFSTGMTPPHLAGPVSGRALGALARVSGQPLAAQEVTDLSAFIAHARLGITALTRLGGLTKDFIREAEPLLPSVTQPTEVLQRHLERLSAFYDSLAVQQEAFSNLSDEQRQAAIQGLFTAIMSGGGQGPATLDLRR